MLEWELACDTTLARQLRVIEKLRAPPIPPLVVSTRLRPAVIDRLLDSLLALHTTDEGRHLLAEGGLARFAVVEDGDYNTIRQMDALAVGIMLEQR